MIIRHAFQSAKADGADNTLVRPSDWNAEHQMVGQYSGPRQTVISAYVDSSGLPNYIAPAIGRLVEFWASAEPLAIAFAAGFDSGGQVDHIGFEGSSAISSGALPAGSTCYLFVNRDPASGALSGGHSLLAPAYSLTAPASPANDQHWFDIPRMKMKRWNGSAWEEKQRVFVGECVTDSSTVTSITHYALRGYYDSGWFQVGIGTTYTKSHNLGVFPLGVQQFLAQNSDGSGWVFIYGAAYDANAASALYRGVPVVKLDRNTVKLRAQGQSLAVFQGESGAVIDPVSAYERIIIRRGW